MADLAADQIINRLAYANGITPAEMRNQIEQTLQCIINDVTQPHSIILSNLFPGGKPSVDDFVVALEYELYDAMMPKFPGWIWDGDGYRNIRLLGQNQQVD